MKKVTNEDTWTTKSGATLRVVSGLLYSDLRCDKIFKLYVNGKYYSASEPNDEGHMGSVKLTDPKDIDRVNALIAKTESHPRWVAKMTKFEQALKDDAMYGDGYDAVTKTMSR